MTQTPEGGNSAHSCDPSLKLRSEHVISSLALRVTSPSDPQEALTLHSPSMNTPPFLLSGLNLRLAPPPRQRRRADTDAELVTAMTRPPRSPPSGGMMGRRGGVAVSARIAPSRC